MIVELANPSDTYNFRTAIRWPSLRTRLWWAIRDFFTRNNRRRYVVTAIDTERGTITCEPCP